MTGIRTGTRLEQLLTLRRRLDHEITTEQHRVATATPPPHPGPSPHTITPNVPNPNTDTMTNQELLAHLNTTTAQVRAWAVNQGLIKPGTTGRLPRTLINDYATHHNNTTSTGDTHP